jgi:hypothetical protein
LLIWINWEGRGHPVNEAKDSPKRQKKKKLRKQINEKCNNTGSADKNKYKKMSLKQFLPLSEAKIQGLHHPAQANLGYFLVWFQSLQLPSTQSESPIAIILLAPKSHVSFKDVLDCEDNFSFFIFRSRLTVTELGQVYILPKFWPTT